MPNDPSGAAPLSRPLTRARLANGLRIVVAPVPDVAAVGITVSYDVGYRSEPSSGLAHLFEHLMFTGSASLPPLAHAEHVQSNGGICNATTTRDHTDYYEVLPPEALELGLFLEADRMRGLRLDQACLDNQVRVVGEEIRRNIENRPFGRFPWIDLPPALFRSFANTHNGYGDIDGLRAVTIAQCHEFFDRHYSPGNAVLVVAGPVDAQRVCDLAEQYFGDIPARRPGAQPSRTEPGSGSRQLTTVDPLAPTPALAIGWRLPPPRSAEHHAAIVLAALLGEGDNSVFRRTIVRERALATQIGAAATLIGRPWDTRADEVFCVSAIHRPDVSADAILGAVRHALADVADEPVRPERLATVQRRIASTWYGEIDPIGARSRRIATAELLYGDGELATEGPGRLARVTGADVSHVARLLLDQPCATLRTVPEDRAGQVLRAGTAAPTGRELEMAR